MTVEVVGEFAGSQVLETTLVNDRHRITLMNYGAVIRRWQYTAGTTAPGASTPVRDIVLGYGSFNFYPEYSPSMGIIAGRVANRTRLGRFTLGQREHQLSINNGRHHLHGGVAGLGKRLWTLETDGSGTRARLGYHSADGEEGYPGEVGFTVDYHLTDEGLLCDMRAQPSEPTPVNLAQHNYYNLDGGGTIRGHRLRVDATHYLPVDNELIPTGKRVPLDGTRFDFRAQRSIEEADPDALGHDHNLVLRAERDMRNPSAELTSSDGSVSLRVITSQPGIQLYSAPSMQTAVPGFNGTPYGPFSGLCLEAQLPPDILNSADQSLAIVTPEAPYHQALALQVSG